MPLTARHSQFPPVWLILLALAAAPAAAQTAVPVIGFGVESPGGVSSRLEQLTSLPNGRIVFAAAEPGSGSEVWASDGSEVGTRLMVDACPGPCDSTPEILGTVRGVALWVTGRPRFAGRIWRSEGSHLGTFALSDGGVPLTVDRPVDDSGDDLVLLPFPHAVLAGAMFFPACGAVHGCGLWRTDNTAAGTRLVAPLSAFGDVITIPLVSTDRGVFFPRRGPAC